MSAPTKPPAVLDAIADKVLRYQPKPRSKPARRRKRRAVVYDKFDGQYHTIQSKKND